MTSIRSIDATLLAKLAARIGTRLGYPRQGVNADGSIPAVDYGVTLRHALVIKHPLNVEWAYEIDATNRPHLVALRTFIQNRITASTATLPADWTPVPTKP